MWIFLNTKTAVVVFILLMLTHYLCAQESNTVKLPIMLGIPAKASINLIGSDLTFKFSPKNDGEIQTLTPSSAGKVWLNYSSIVEWGSSNSIYVSLGDGNVPAEVSIKLKIEKDAGVGSGQTGQPTDPITLSYSPQPIITNIGSCFTGKGEGKGHLLTYSWVLSPNYDPDLIKIEDLKIVTSIIYTIVNN